MKARVFVTLKPSVFDPQGQTIADALHSMGYAGVGDVRQGKYFELELAAASADQAPPWPPKSPTSCWRTRSSRAVTRQVGSNASNQRGERSEPWQAMVSHRRK